jgi:hypothetical protein
MNQKRESIGGVGKFKNWPVVDAWRPMAFTWSCGGFAHG